MTCDRACELLSDYLEGCLDRADAGAVELHLASCAACGRELEGLRATWRELDSLPMIEPPADLEPRVLASMRRDREQARELWSVGSAPAAAPPAWLLRLRSLSPARVALASSAATLLLAGALVFPQVRVYTNGWMLARQETAPPTAPVRPATPEINFSYRESTPDSLNVDVIVSASQALPGTEVTITSPESGNLLGKGQASLAGGRPLRTPVLLSRAVGASQPLLVEVHSPAVGYHGSFWCALPLQAPEADRVSATFVETPLHDVLRQMAARTGKPVILDATMANQPVTATVVGQSAPAAWRQLLEPLNLHARETGGNFQIVPL